MSDLIDRQDAVSEIHKYFCEEIDKTSHGTDEDGEDVYTDMPTVNSLLSHNKQLSKRIEMLQPAQPEIIYCKDCEYTSSKYPIADGRYWCTRHSCFMEYCSDAERREE